jgi:hypothetical protein
VKAEEKELYASWIVDFSWDCRRFCPDWFVHLWQFSERSEPDGAEGRAGEEQLVAGGCAATATS